MSRISAVIPNTYEELLFDAGIVFENLDYSAATDATSLYALVRAAIATDECLGATRGGLNWSSTAEYDEIELDDVFVTVKGSVQKGKITVTVALTLTQFSPTNAQRLINASDITEEGNITTLRERTSIDLDDYMDHLVIVARQGVGNYAIIDMENVINVSAGTVQTNNQGQAEMAVTFQASVGDPESTTAPYGIKWFKNAPTP